MPDINIDTFLQRQMRLAQLERNGLQTYITPSLAETLRDIRRILADVDNITSQRQLRRLERAITEAVQSQSGWAALTDELTSVAELDNQFMAATVGAGTSAATREQVERLASRTMMVLKSGDATRSGFWNDFVQNNLGSQAENVNAVLRAGYSSGLTGRDMRGQIENLYDGMLTRHAETLARTGYQHYSSVGRQAFGQANSDIIEREVPIVTFDSRTSDTCVSIAARYGQKGWEFGQNPIGPPPYHYGCRTSLAYLAGGQSLTGTRATQFGQVDAKTSINQFVKDQSPEWQEKLLGSKRAQLFREGKLSLRNLTDSNLQPLTLDEILD